MVNCPVIDAEFSNFLHNLHNLCKNPEKSLIMIIDVMSLCSLFCVCCFNFEDKTRLRGVVFTICHDTSHIKIPLCHNLHKLS